MKKYLFSLLAFGICVNSYANIKCGKLLLITSGMDQSGVDSSFYSDKELRKLERYFLDVQKTVEANQAHTVINDFSVSRINRHDYDFDYTLYVGYSTNSSDVFSSRKYYATLRQSDTHDILDSKTLRKSFSLLPKTRRALREVLGLLTQCSI